MMDVLTLLHLLLVLGCAQLLLPRGREGEGGGGGGGGATWAAEGLLAFALGMTSFIVGAGSGLSLSLASAASMEASPSFLIGSTALLVLGPASGLAGAAAAWRHQRTRAVALAALLDAGVLLALAPVALEVGVAKVLVTVFLLVVGIAVVFLLGSLSRVGTVVRYVDRHLLARARWREGLAAPARGDIWWLGLALAGVIMVMARSPMMITVAGALAAAAGVHTLAMRLAGGPKFPALPLVAAALIPYAIMLHHLAGGGWSLTDLQRVPFTTDIEIQLLPLVTVAAFGLAALWPVHGLIPRGVLAPVGGILLLRLGADLLPAGLYVWQPVLSPLALVSVWWGALTGRATLLLTGWAFQALVTGLPDARPGALGLLWVALGLGMLGGVPERHRSKVTRVLFAFAAVGIIWTLPAMLQTQLVYSLLALGGVGVALWRKTEV